MGHGIQFFLVDIGLVSLAGQLGLCCARVIVFSVDGQFASLAEGLSAPSDAAHEWFLPRVSVLMLFEVLRQDEALAAILANVLLLVGVLDDVTLERVLSREDALAPPDIAFELLFLFHILTRTTLALK